jgi:hypothetical protein
LEEVLLELEVHRGIAPFIDPQDLLGHLCPWTPILGLGDNSKCWGYGGQTVGV